MMVTKRSFLKVLGALFVTPAVAQDSPSFTFDASLPLPESVVGNSIKGVQGFSGSVLTADGWMQPESIATQSYVDSVFQGFTVADSKPLNPIAGSIYYDRADGKTYVYSGSNWSVLAFTDGKFSRQAVCQYCKTPDSGKSHCTSCGAPSQLSVTKFSERVF